MARTLGTLTKVVVNSPFAPARNLEDVESVLMDDLAEPIQTEEAPPDYEPVLDDWLIFHQRGVNGERPEAETTPVESTIEEPLIVDIDDGAKDTKPSRRGVLQRVNDAPRTFRKFNRFSSQWE